jgi:MerR family transcriptional regulator, light-induced transcriptional regulator
VGTLNTKAVQNAAFDTDCRQMITSVIEDQILPRLLHAHPAEVSTESGTLRAQRGQNAHAPILSETLVNEFARHCCQGTAISYVEKLQNQGITHEAIYLGLITPAARLLGKQWEQDHLDFMQVTSALIQMHEVAHHLNYHMQSGPKTIGEQKRVILACAPGSQHILGIVIVGAFFNRAGWQTVIEISATPMSLAKLLKDEWFDVIGISVALASQCDELAELIADLRDTSKNKNLFVMLGGPVFSLGEAKASDYGADAICSDPDASIRLASSAVGL